ncbi:CocE/NonD family hydrolase [Nocardioides sp. BP30]|uniref:CocE/NonD family hydrolase n=1 Tax=Nocardioides sp. BP30 TaxID=3036374 RepID=UPI002468E090|nr:CocE/NonD family hydrolase [Nocardioides sp. BP30]WGL50730.1 CocE/NonD family hydrolase [Nocardioides sp. BP30]
MRRIVSVLLAVLVGILAVLTLPGSPARAGTGTGTWTPRPEDYPQTVTRRDLAIPMDDGTVLRGDLTLPADATGTAVVGRFPVVVTITAYNKSVTALPGGSGLAGSDPSYLVKRGYAQLTVDARGTGSSEGTWCAFCTRETQDYGEVMTWAHEQPWSDGDTAMTGPSYMGIAQIFAAAEHPAGLKAIFPQVPAADVYRDVVASGGQIDVGFIPLWIGLVTLTGIVPPAVTATDPTSGLAALVDHLASLATWSAPTMISALGGQEDAYDGDFYAQRSPINVVDKVDVPTFLVGGEYDLFQRGTPLLFENLQKRGVPTKMIIGPWNHLQGSSGADVADAGDGSLAELQLRWFDHYVKGLPDPELDSSDGDIAPITYYEQGTDRWRTARTWVDPRDTQATVVPLSGSASPGTPATLGTTAGSADGVSTVPPIPVAGLCSRSADQWTAGIISELQLFNSSCLESNNLNDQTATLFRTPPLTHDLPILGPIDAHLYVDSTSGDGLLSVAVNDVAPDGTVSRLTGGWQVISLRALEASRTRYLDGRVLQPYHPFTKASESPTAPGQVVPVDVEVFPTGADIQPGHRLELSVQSFDVPHLLPTLPDLLSTLGTIHVHASTTYPSALVLPTRDKAYSDGVGVPVTGPQQSVTPAGTGAPATDTAAPHVRIAVHGRRVVVKVPATGTVWLKVDRRALAHRRLHHGKAVFRLPRLTGGRHRAKAIYLGSVRTSAVKVFRVS